MLALCLTVTLGFTGCSGSGGGGSSTGGGSTGGDNKVYNWSFYSGYGPEDGACCVVWPRLFEEVDKATGGRLKITTYWYGQHPYEPEDMLKVLADGAAELAYFYGSYLSSVEPIFAADALPLMFPKDSMETWKVLTGLWGNFEHKKTGFYEKILDEKWNASVVHMLPCSPQRLYSRGFDLSMRDSLKGKKIRSYNPELAKFVELMGGTPIPISYSEVYTSLATNLIDGLITSVAFAESGGFFDYVDTIGAWEIAQATDGLMVDNAALAALPDDLRAIFLDVMTKSALKPEMLEVEENDEIVKRLTSEGVKFIIPADEEWDYVRGLCQKEIWGPWLEQTGAQGQALLDEIDRLKKL